MKVRVFRSGSGDATLLTSDTGKHILVDGGVFDAYADHWAGFAGKLRSDGEALELVCISHIDRDHIGGILRMLDNEVAWRLYDYRVAQGGNPNKKKPTLKRPPEVRAIWHNAFLEKIRQRQVRSSNHGQAVLDVTDMLFRMAQIYAGAGGGTVENAASAIADRLHFLGQSVGDAIEVSRRIGAKQLNIPLNPEFGGEFVLRKRGQSPFTIGGFTITVLGPTQADMDALEDEWNKKLGEYGSYLNKLLSKHKKAEKILGQDDVSDILAMAREAAFTLAGNQNVTPPNLASIVMLVENDNRTALLTGDADDPSIIAGLKATGRLDGNDQIRVDVYKVPHHGAHNSYSDDLARTVIADDYVFCGNGEHHNPEPDIIDGYLRVLLEGSGGQPPALPAGIKPTFWFNCGPAVAEHKHEKHWDRVEHSLRSWQQRHPGRFRYRFMRSGDSFLVT